MLALSCLCLQFVRECESRLVVDYKDTYIYTHTRDMVREENSADLSNLFLLFNSIPKALQPIVQEFENHVKEKGELNRFLLSRAPLNVDIHGQVRCP